MLASERLSVPPEKGCCFCLKPKNSAKFLAALGIIWLTTDFVRLYYMEKARLRAPANYWKCLGTSGRQPDGSPCLSCCDEPSEETKVTTVNDIVH